MRRSIGLWGAAVMGISTVAGADPVPVIPFGVSDGAASAGVERVATALGPTALRGDGLRDALQRSFGRFAPREDLLAGARAEVSAGWDGYFRSGPRAARRRLADAVTAMEAAPEALALRDDNRASYLRALGMLTRIDLEARRTEDAEAWGRRALRLDPSWSPPTNDFPPPVVALAARLRGSGGATGEGRITVRLPREGCGVTLDGATLPGTSREQSRALAAGAHRVWAACDGASRVREVTVRGGETVTVAIDPELDARLQLSTAASLVYPSVRDQDALLPSDLATVGRALGASQVVGVSATGAWVIDVASGRALGEVQLSQADLADRLAALRSGRTLEAPAVAARAPAPVPTRRSSGSGAGPWALVGAGGAAVAAGVVFWVLRSGAVDDLSARCPFVDGVPACGDADSLRLAGEDRDRANLWQGMSIGAFAAGGVAITTGLLWYALGGRSSERVAVSAGLRGGSVTLRW